MEYWERHNLNLRIYSRKINAIYDEAIKEIAKIGINSGRKLDEDFEWAKIPHVKDKLDEFLARMNSLLYENISGGVRVSWNLANEKNDKMASDWLSGHSPRKKNVDDYFEHNIRALESFLQRKERGMNLSERVWKLTEEFKKETEYGIAEVMRDGIPGGVSADSLQRKVRQYLNEPNKIFRRVRDKETGELKPSRAMAAYHPGRGVYRSSRKNALRLTVTETNMAYHEADKLRVQKFDFVLAIRVVLSNNHTCNGVPFVDICDELQGVYPKNFHFIGWHPHCRCHVETILKSEDNVEDERTKRRNEWRKKAGLEPIKTKGVKNEKPMTELPQNYVKWRAHQSKAPYWEIENDADIRAKSGPTINSKDAQHAIDVIKRDLDAIDKGQKGFRIPQLKIGSLESHVLEHLNQKDIFVIGSEIMFDAKQISHMLRNKKVEIGKAVSDEHLYDFIGDMKSYNVSFDTTKRNLVYYKEYDEFIVKFIVGPNYKLKDNVFTNMLITAGRIIDKSSVLKNKEYEKIEKAGK